MAYEIPGFSWPCVAAADLSASQFRFCDVAATGKVNVPAAGGRVVGVRQNKPKTNEAVTIVTDGISMVECGAAVTLGGNVTTDNVGRVINAAATNQIHGIALEAGAAAGVIIAVLLKSAPAVA